MAMGRRAKQRQQQEQFWVAHSELPQTVAHPFYQSLNQLLEERGFDEFVEGRCERFYAEEMGRPSLTLVLAQFRTSWCSSKVAIIDSLPPYDVCGHHHSHPAPAVLLKDVCLSTGCGSKEHARR
jgi:hypothetical protein